LNYYISSSGEYFYDFPYLKAISGFSSLKLQYLLDKEEISRLKYMDVYVYKLDDLYDPIVQRPYSADNSGYG
jgi:hypothetical protein